MQKFENKKKVHSGGFIKSFENLVHTFPVYQYLNQLQQKKLKSADREKFV
jgi:hypothetical protein